LYKIPYHLPVFLPMLRKTIAKPHILKCVTGAYTSFRPSSDYLIDQPKYQWLKDLGLKNLNDGVFDGEWKTGQGPVSLIAFKTCIP